MGSPVGLAKALDKPVRAAGGGLVKGGLRAIEGGLGKLKPTVDEAVEATPAARGNVSQLITKPLRDTHRSLGERVAERVASGQKKAAAYDGWKYGVGDRIRSQKTGNIFEVTGRHWQDPIGKNPSPRQLENSGPMYYVESVSPSYKAGEEGSSRTTMYGDDRTHNIFDLMDGPKGFAGGGLVKNAATHADDAFRHAKGAMTTLREYLYGPEAVQRFSNDFKKIPIIPEYKMSPEYLRRYGRDTNSMWPTMDEHQSMVAHWLAKEYNGNQQRLPGYGRTWLGGESGINGFTPKGGISFSDNPRTVADMTDLTSGGPGDIYVEYLTNMTAPKERGIGSQMLNELRGRYPGTISLQPTVDAMPFYDRMGMDYDKGTGLFYLPRGMNFEYKKAHGGLVKGPLNLMNPSTSARGPFNVKMNMNNMLQKSRAVHRRGPI